jgi:hypothetical protein
MQIMEINNQVESEPKIDPIQTQLGSMVTSFLNQINSKIERFAQPNTHGIFFAKTEDEEKNEGFGVVQGGNGNSTADPNMTLDEYCEVVDEYMESGEVISEWTQNDSSKSN